MSEQISEQKRKFPSIAIVAIIMAVICGISLYIRIALPYDKIFVDDWVFLRETDAYYYIRNIETLVNNFPSYNTFDPYMYYPGGGGGLVRPFFAWLVAAISLLVGRGAPTLHTIEAVGAFIPPILGTLTLIAVYFIGKELFNRWVGVISAALAAILPGEFLHRSLLGFTDHHAAEILFSAVCILFLIMAIKRAREREISFRHILNRDRAVITKPLVYTLLAGIFLGIYLLTWQGGLLFVFIVFVYLAIQFIADHLWHKSSDYLCIVGTPVFLIAFLMILPVLGGSKLDAIYRLSMPIAILVPIVLNVISRFMAARALKPIYYPLVLLVLTGIGLAALHAINPTLFQSVFSQFNIFDPSGAWQTVLEMQSLTAQIAWYNFTISFFISFVSMVMLIYLAIKERSADKGLFLVWSIVMLMAVLGQRRFGYYYAVNAALLTGYFTWKMLDLVGLRRLLTKSKEVAGVVKKFRKREKVREKARKKSFMQPRGAWVGVILVGIVLFFLIFFPNISIVRATANASIIMEEGWYTSLLWLKDNSPEPFDDPDFYYELYPPSSEFEYPESAYGVMSWWDYGYFIMQLAHRIPNANPGQVGAVQAGKFLLAQDESSVQAIIDQYNLRTRYVAIDYLTPVGKFHALPEWAGGNVSEFYEAYYYYRAELNQLMPVPLAYPAYYYTMAARLYFFDGEVQPGSNTLVISYQDQVSADGIKYKLITSAKIFSSYADAQTFISSQQLTNYNIMGVFPSGNVVVKYEEKVSTGGIHYEEITDVLFYSEPYYDYMDAQAYISSQQTGNYKILDPFISPVPLEELENCELVHSSDSLHTFATLEKKVPSVKIFEYLDSSES